LAGSGDQPAANRRSRKLVGASGRCRHCIGCVRRSRGFPPRCRMATAITLFQFRRLLRAPSRNRDRQGHQPRNGASRLDGGSRSGVADGSRERCRLFFKTTFTADAGPCLGTRSLGHPGKARILKRRHQDSRRAPLNRLQQASFRGHHRCGSVHRSGLCKMPIAAVIEGPPRFGGHGKVSRTLTDDSGRCTKPHQSQGPGPTEPGPGAGCGRIDWGVHQEERFNAG